jgi:zinc protease
MRMRRVQIGVILLLLSAIWGGWSRAEAGALAQREVLPNGLTLLVAERPAVPIATISVLVRAGSALDPAGKPGVANLVAQLLTQGTASRTAPEISEAVDFIGGSLDVEAGLETTTVTLSLLSKDLDAGLDLLADIVLHPAFTSQDVQRKIQEVVAGIRRDHDDPGTVSYQAFMKALYGSHPFGTPVEGTETSVPTITREDLARFHDAWFRPNMAIVTVVGDVKEANLRQGLQARFGGWQPGRAGGAPPAAPAGVSRRVVQTIQRTVTQANITLGAFGVTRENPDFYAVQVMNYLLGGGFSSYLISTIRDQKGWAYDVGSAFSAHKLSGEFTISLQSKNELANQAIAAAIEQVRKIREQPVDPQALNDAKAYLTGSFPLRLDTGKKLASWLAVIEYYGLGLDYADRYPALINRVTVPDVQRVAQKYLDPEHYVLAVVADMTTAQIR